MNNFNVEYWKIQTQIQRVIPRLNRDPITQVKESRGAVLGTYSVTPWKYVKSKHENGLKF